MEVNCGEIVMITYESEMEISTKWSAFRNATAMQCDSQCLSRNSSTVNVHSTNSTWQIGQKLNDPTNNNSNEATVCIEINQVLSSSSDESEESLVRESSDWWVFTLFWEWHTLVPEVEGAASSDEVFGWACLTLPWLDRPWSLEVLPLADGTRSWANWLEVRGLSKREEAGEASITCPGWCKYGFSCLGFAGAEWLLWAPEWFEFTEGAEGAMEMSWSDSVDRSSAWRTWGISSLQTAWRGVKLRTTCRHLSFNLNTETLRRQIIKTWHFAKDYQ